MFHHIINEELQATLSRDEFIARINAWYAEHGRAQHGQEVADRLSVTPGTFSIDVSADRHEYYIHADFSAAKEAQS